MTPTPKGAKFVSGSLETGRLILIRDDGSTARCNVLMCLGTLVDNEDSTFDITGLEGAL